MISAIDEALRDGAEIQRHANDLLAAHQQRAHPQDPHLHQRPARGDCRALSRQRAAGPQCPGGAGGQ
eukprot:5980076-Lingulodinium_polyedra.AAC.1